MYLALSSYRLSISIFLLLIPFAAINKILEVHGPSAKVHVVAHCVGGSAIHIAIMGGHVSATHIASLSCTNSSMFFKLNAMSTFKMWLPLIPVSSLLLSLSLTIRICVIFVEEEIKQKSYSSKKRGIKEKKNTAVLTLTIVMIDEYICRKHVGKMKNTRNKSKIHKQ